MQARNIGFFIGLADFRTLPLVSTQGLQQMHDTRDAKPNLTPPEASDYLRNKFGIRLAVRTMAKLRCVSSSGPVFVKAGRAILYPQDGLDGYAEKIMSAPMRSTSDRNPIAHANNRIAA